MMDRLDPVIPFTAPKNGAAVLERYADDRFGFLRLEITRDTIELRDDCVPRPQEKWRAPPRCARESSSLSRRSSTSTSCWPRRLRP